METIRSQPHLAILVRTVTGRIENYVTNGHMWGGVIGKLDFKHGKFRFLLSDFPFFLHMNDLYHRPYVLILMSIDA